MGLISERSTVSALFRCGKAISSRSLCAKAEVVMVSSMSRTRVVFMVIPNVLNGRDYSVMWWCCYKKSGGGEWADLLIFY